MTWPVPRTGVGTTVLGSMFQYEYVVLQAVLLGVGVQDKQISRECDRRGTDGESWVAMDSKEVHKLCVEVKGTSQEDYSVA